MPRLNKGALGQATEEGKRALVNANLGRSYQSRAEYDVCRVTLECHIETWNI